MAVPDAEDKAVCPSGGLAGLPDTVLAPALGPHLPSAFDPAPRFSFVCDELLDPRAIFEIAGV